MKLKALVKIVEAGRIAKQVDDAMQDVGYGDTPYFHIYGKLSDAVYELLGENTETFEQSLSYKIMHASDMSLMQLSEMLSLYSIQAE